MINQLTQTFTLTPAQQAAVNALMPFTRDTWESYAAHDIRDLIGVQLRNFQNGKCCFCGLLYDETGRGEIEHIAPKKARPNEYPEFSFSPQNLAMACQLCNSSTMKGQYNSIDIHNANYGNCTFKIVHPYLHNHALHYRWNHGLLRVVITGITNEAKESIRLFKLAEEHRTTARAKQKNQERLVTLYNLPQNTIDRIKRALTFRN
ncbi:MAG: hypothetical protein WC622_11260 [Pedobacter sp.]|jgi:uncharacterized protein (TIGR02646 family)|uniref:hypothetical protein n=1 Tax=Pedobacter sp. TaxID=1411316 RepID=UPI00356B1BDB